MLNCNRPHIRANARANHRRSTRPKFFVMKTVPKTNLLTQQAHRDKTSLRKTAAAFTKQTWTLSFSLLFMPGQPDWVFFCLWEIMALGKYIFHCEFFFLSVLLFSAANGLVRCFPLFGNDIWIFSEFDTLYPTSAFSFFYYKLEGKWRPRLTEDLSEACPNSTAFEVSIWVELCGNKQ